MKKFLTVVTLLSVVYLDASAQTKKVKANTTKTVAKKTTPTPQPSATSGGELVSTGNYAAYGNKFTIADPVVNRLNANATGANIWASGSGLMGMPRGTYGFGNGKLFLRTTAAISSGTGYGSGAVGTGTTINAMGTSEATLGVNGKAPEAGRSLWGNGMVRPTKDSTRNQP